jgi:hypothetical protein
MPSPKPVPLELSDEDRQAPRDRGEFGGAQFIDKVRDIVGLYLDPPSGALVLCVEKEPDPGAGIAPRRSRRRC